MSPIRFARFLLFALLLGFALVAPSPASSRMPGDAPRGATQATADDQLNPVAAPDGAGGVIIAWADYRAGASNADIYARGLDGDGTPRWSSLGVCVASGMQSSPRIIPDGTGGAIVTWTDFRSGTADIYAQHVLAAGTVDPAWPPGGRALCTATGAQDSVALASDGEGGAIVTWSDYRGSSFDSNIYAQHVLTAGAVDPGWPADGLALCVASGHQSSPKIVPDGAGGAIVAWNDYRGGASGPTDIFAQHVVASGVVDAAWPVDGRAVCAASGAQTAVEVTTDGAGGALLAWLDQGGVSGSDVYAQHLPLSGIPSWTADGVAICAAANDQTTPALVPDGSGGAIVSWLDARTASLPNAYAQHVLAVGAVDPSWPANGVALCTSSGDKLDPTIVADGIGGAIVAWYDHRGADYDVYAQHVRATGVVDPAWSADGLALCTAGGEQERPAIVTDGCGGAIVAWEDYRDPQVVIRAARVSAAGPLSPAWTADGVALGPAAGSQSTPMVIPDGLGGALIAWWDNREGFDNADIYVHHMLSSGVADPAWPAQGRAVCTAVNDQRVPQLVSDGEGGAIVAWEDFRSGAWWDIYAHHVLASGALDPAWPDSGRALCMAVNNQLGPRILADGEGGAFVAWRDRRTGVQWDIYAHHVLASGALDPAWPDSGGAMCAAIGDQSNPALATDGRGGALVAWEDHRPSGFGIYAQHVVKGGIVDPAWPAEGRGLRTRVESHQYVPAIIADGEGGALVAWYGRADLISTEVYAQHLMAGGEVDPAWPADGRAVCMAANDQYGCTIAGDGLGGAFIAWVDTRSGSESDIYAQHVQASGDVDPDSPVDGRAVCTAGSDQFDPYMVSDGAGGAHLCWWDLRAWATDGGYDIYAHHLLASGGMDSDWPGDGLPLCTADQGQEFPALAPDGTGGAIVVWQDGRNGFKFDLRAAKVTRAGVVGTPWTVDGETSTLLSLASATAEPGAVKLAWSTAESGLEATLQRCEEGGPWTALARLTSDGTGRMRYVDEAVTAGGRYGYRLAVPTADGEAYFGEAWVTLPAYAAFRLAGLRPNPSAGRTVVAFSLPGPGDATVALMDVSGRTVSERRLAGLSAGEHELSLGGAKLAPGLYLVRLTHGGRTLTRKAIVTR